MTVSYRGVRGLWPKQSKYRAIRTEFGGRAYSSKREARHAAELDILVKAGEIRAVIPQVSIPVPGTDRRMVLDFLLLMPDGTVRWQDVKGMATREWSLKAEIVQRAYGIEIEIVK